MAVALHRLCWLRSVSLFPGQAPESNRSVTAERAEYVWNATSQTQPLEAGR